MLKSDETKTILFPQPSTKSPLTLTDISNLTPTIPNTTNLLWPKLYTTESIHVMNKDDKATLHKQIQYTLTLNGFPRKFSCLALKEKARRPTKSFKSFTSLPYIHGTTDKI